MVQPKNAVALATQEITIETDSRDILANARRDIERYDLDDYFIVDVDAHHVESDSWVEVIDHIDNEVLRHNARAIGSWPNARNVALSAGSPGLQDQDVHGRIPHQTTLAEPVQDRSVHRDVTLVRRAMDSMGIDVQVIFPQVLLGMGLHPDVEVATALTYAYNRWFTSTILTQEPRIKAFVALPFENPKACLDIVAEFGDLPGVIGFMVTSQRHAGVHKNAYMPLYRELEERGMPIAFHAGPRRNDTWTSTMNRFLSVHAMSFVTCNMAHLTNWIINGLPERFPNLKVIWVESGLAWIPFMMQRLDHEYLMRQSEAPLLRRRPSEYMTEMYYTSQPMEADNLELLEMTFKAMKAETQLLYSSDWPHWDFDVPGRIAALPFLTEKARRNILGETARTLFKL
jgi:predicted TIM-barrel fold metal-dependent hydrolase